MSEEEDKQNCVSAANMVSPPANDRIDPFLSAALVLVIVVTLGMTILVITLPKENEHFTDFFILDANGMTEKYPEEIIAGQNYPMYIGVGNHEGRNATYMIETWQMNITFDPVTNTTHIVTMMPGDRLSVTLAENETSVIPYSLSVTEAENNRVAFLLFTETAPGPIVTGNDRINASYQDLHLRVTVLQGIYHEGYNDIT